MTCSKSSKSWLSRQKNDIYVDKARKHGYRSRAAYKLIEIHKKEKIFKSGMTVIDLGAAPGGWSQVAAQYVSGTGKVIALDLLPMKPLDNVDFVQGDFREQNVFDQLLLRIGKLKQVDLVISDIAPNLSGISHVDMARAVYLVEMVFDLAKQVLAQDGVLLVKLFHGEGFDTYVHMLRSYFAKVIIKKPGASRADSKEVYLLARGIK
jgi:23S rRNA (uridine2552-2'-O)-methyltransferase